MGTRGFILTLAVTTALATALTACAGGGGGPRGRGGPGMMQAAPSQIISPDALIFMDFDTNKDRQITRAELAAGVETDWADAAKSQSSIGYLEWRDWLVKVMGSDQFDVGPVGFDTNSDLRITKDEFATALTRRFNELDKNSDGVLTRAELVKPVLGRDTRGMGPIRSDGEGPPSGGERGDRRGGPTGGPGGDRQ
jgi:hypothetical protein